MNRSLLLSSAFLAAFAASAAHASVRVEGTVLFDPDEAAAMVPSAGSDGERFDAAVKALFATGRFDDVSVTRSGGVTVVRVTERPLVASVSFEGAALLSRDALEAAAALTPGEPLAGGALDAAAGRVMRAYAASARPDARVTWRTEAAGRGAVAVTFAVEEGARAGVTDLRFRGAEAFSRWRLRAQLSTKETGLFSRFTRADAYDPAKVEADAAALRSFYVSQGYADAAVTLADVDRVGGGFSVTLDVAEGPRYAVGAVAVDSSLKGFDPAPARLSGAVWTPELLAAEAGRLEAAALAAGYRGAVATPRTDRRPGGVVDVTFLLDPGPRTYVERIEVTGNERTRDDVVRREIDIAEGDMFDRTLLRRAESRLVATGLFDRVALRVAPGPAEDRAVLVVEVAERRTGEFEVGGGWSSASGIGLNASLSQSNLAGTGRGARAYAARSDAGTSFGLSLADPALFGSRAGAEAGFFRNAGHGRADGARAFARTDTGAKAALSLPLSGNLTAGLGYGLTHRRIADVSPELSGGGGPVLLTPGTSVASALSWSLVWSSLDRPASPSEGARFSFAQEAAGLGGDARWLRTEVAADRFVPLALHAPSVVRFSGRAGHVAAPGGGLSWLDHFRAGTGPSVRGFETDGFGPRDEATGFHLGGRAYATATAEIVTPLPVIPAEYGLKAAFFADAGTIWSPDPRSVASAGADVVSGSPALRLSAGAGLLWESPFGPLRADFGFPLVKAGSDRTQVFSFSGGTRF